MLGPRKVILLSGGRLRRRDDFDTLAPWWTSDVGTAAVVGGALRGATQGDVLLNLITNGEFTTDTAGWDVVSGTVIVRVDSELDPGVSSVPSGGADRWVMKLTKTSTLAGRRAYVTLAGAVVGAGYRYSALAYQPAGNVELPLIITSSLRGWAAELTANMTLDDTWEALHITGSVAASTNPVLDVAIIGSTQADLVYADRCECYRRNTVLTAPCRPNGTVQAGVAMPAAGVVPRSLILRRSDSLNYWEARMLPNTAATDLQLYEVNAGAHQLRASADIDWTAGATDEVQVSLKGTTIEVYHRKAGAGVWTLGCSYASATHNQTASRHGGMLWETGVNAFTYWSYTS